ncbi:MAG TPA: Bax inhibitor-1/YccA family protein [Candidatus Limnocylindrales bacterium]
MYRDPRMVPSQLGVRPAAQLSAGFLSQAFLWMFAGLGVTAVVAWLVGSNAALVQGAASLFLPVIIGQFVLVMVISAGINRMSATIALLLFFVYSATMGITLSLILLAYGYGAAVSAFVTASVMFGGAAAYGAVTGRSLANIGGYLFMGLLGIIAASFLNLFIFKSAGVDLGISFLGVLIFVALTAWNVQKIKNGDYAAITGSMEKGAVIAALALYLDFINLFLFLLRIFGGGNRR